MSPDRPHHLSDDELQAIAEGTSAGPKLEAHLAGCEQCLGEVERYARLADSLAHLEQPLPPADFTANVLARLPAPKPALSADDLLAALFATGAAVVCALLFQRADGASFVFHNLHHLPARAFAGAMVEACLHGQAQVPVLVFLSGATLLIGAPLWRLLSAPRTVA
jgi:hypothetical protein